MPVYADVSWILTFIFIDCHPFRVALMPPSPLTEGQSYHTGRFTSGAVYFQAVAGISWASSEAQLLQQRLSSNLSRGLYCTTWIYKNPLTPLPAHSDGSVRSLVTQTLYSEWESRGHPARETYMYSMWGWDWSTLLSNRRPSEPGHIVLLRGHCRAFSLPFLKFALMKASPIIHQSWTHSWKRVKQTYPHAAGICQRRFRTGTTNSWCCILQFATTCCYSEERMSITINTATIWRSCRLSFLAWIFVLAIFHFQIRSYHLMYLA